MAVAVLSLLTVALLLVQNGGVEGDPKRPLLPPDVKLTDAHLFGSDDDLESAFLRASLLESGTLGDPAGASAAAQRLEGSQHPPRRRTEGLEGQDHAPGEVGDSRRVWGPWWAFHPVNEGRESETTQTDQYTAPVDTPVLHATPLTDEGPHLAPSSTGQRDSTSGPGQHDSPSDAGQRGSPSKAGQHGSPSKAGQRGSPSKAGQHGSPSKAGQRGSQSKAGQHGSPDNANQHDLLIESGRFNSPSKAGQLYSLSSTSQYGSPNNADQHASPSNTYQHDAISNTGQLDSPSNIAPHDSSSDTGRPDSPSNTDSISNTAPYDSLSNIREPLQFPISHHTPPVQNFGRTRGGFRDQKPNPISLQTDPAVHSGRGPSRIPSDPVMLRANDVTYPIPDPYNRYSGGKANDVTYPESDHYNRYSEDTASGITYPKPDPYKYSGDTASDVAYPVRSPYTRYPERKASEITYPMPYPYNRYSENKANGVAYSVLDLHSKYSEGKASDITYPKPDPLANGITYSVLNPYNRFSEGKANDITYPRPDPYNRYSVLDLHSKYSEGKASDITYPKPDPLANGITYSVLSPYNRFSEGKASDINYPKPDPFANGVTSSVLNPYNRFSEGKANDITYPKPDLLANGITYSVLSPYNRFSEGKASDITYPKPEPLANGVTYSVLNPYNRFSEGKANDITYPRPDPYNRYSGDEANDSIYPDQDPYNRHSEGKASDVTYPEQDPYNRHSEDEANDVTYPEQDPYNRHSDGKASDVTYPERNAFNVYAVRKANDMKSFPSMRSRVLKELLGSIPATPPAPRATVTSQGTTAADVTAGEKSSPEKYDYQGPAPYSSSNRGSDRYRSNQHSSNLYKSSELYGSDAHTTYQRNPKRHDSGHYISDQYSLNKQGLKQYTSSPYTASQDPYKYEPFNTNQYGSNQNNPNQYKTNQDNPYVGLTSQPQSPYSPQNDAHFSEFRNNQHQDAVSNRRQNLDENMAIYNKISLDRPSRREHDYLQPGRYHRVYPSGYIDLTKLPRIQTRIPYRANLYDYQSLASVYQSNSFPVSTAPYRQGSSFPQQSLYQDFSGRKGRAADAYASPNPYYIVDRDFGGHTGDQDPYNNGGIVHSEDGEAEKFVKPHGQDVRQNEPAPEPYSSSDLQPTRGVYPTQSSERDSRKQDVRVYDDFSYSDPYDSDRNGYPGHKEYRSRTEQSSPPDHNQYRRLKPLNSERQSAGGAYQSSVIQGPAGDSFQISPSQPQSSGSQSPARSGRRQFGDDDTIREGEAFYVPFTNDYDSLIQMLQGRVSGRFNGQAVIQNNHNLPPRHSVPSYYNASSSGHALTPENSYHPPSNFGTPNNHGSDHSIPDDVYDYGTTTRNDLPGSYQPGTHGFPSNYSPANNYASDNNYDSYNSYSFPVSFGSGNRYESSNVDGFSNRQAPLRQHPSNNYGFSSYGSPRRYAAYNRNSNHELPNSYGYPRNHYVSNFGSPNNYGSRNQNASPTGFKYSRIKYTSPNNYGYPNSYSFPGSYGSPENYETGNNYALHHSRGTSNSYDSTANYGSPRNYETRNSYGLPNNYGLDVDAYEDVAQRQQPLSDGGDQQMTRQTFGNRYDPAVYMGAPQSGKVQTNQEAGVAVVLGGDVLHDPVLTLEGMQRMLRHR